MTNMLGGQESFATNQFLKKIWLKLKIISIIRRNNINTAMNNNYDYLFKFIIIGDSNVGKSCLLLRFTEEKFKSEHEPTLGVQFGSKHVKIMDHLIKVQIWDTAGQQSFKSITRSYYKGSIAALLVYDITKKDSFDNIIKWLQEVKTHSHEKVEIALIGNKSDLQHKRQVTKEDGERFAAKNGFCFFQTSALNGQDVNEAFKTLATKILKKIESKQINADNQSSYGIRRGKKGGLNKKDSNVNIMKPAVSARQKKEGCSC